VEQAVVIDFGWRPSATVPRDGVDFVVATAPRIVSLSIDDAIGRQPRVIHDAGVELVRWCPAGWVDILSGHPRIPYAQDPRRGMFAEGDVVAPHRAWTTVDQYRAAWFAAAAWREAPRDRFVVFFGPRPEAHATRWLSPEDRRLERRDARGPRELYLIRQRTGVAVPLWTTYTAEVAAKATLSEFYVCANPQHPFASEVLDERELRWCEVADFPADDR
jgi:hypothetical protein